MINRIFSYSGYRVSTILSSLIHIVLFSFLLSACQMRTEVSTKDSFNWKKATIYFVYIDRFYNGSTENDQNYGRVTDYGSEQMNAATFHGGDLIGLTQKLKEGYFTNLGVEVLWITGVYEQIHGFTGGGNKNDFPHYGYHGYYPQDWTMIDRNYGTIEEFREFVNEAHKQGLRVIMDAGLNHPGYPTMLDAVQNNFGGIKLTAQEAVTHTLGWSYNDNYAPQTDASWQNWWGKDWIRGADEETEDPRRQSIAYLPDFRTESLNPVTAPLFLKTKWSKEIDADKWINPSAKNLRQDLNLAPTDYLIEWTTAWVKEFGIDGFRCDVVENVDAFRWKQLSDSCNSALSEWRMKNPTQTASKWSDKFWMTGDIPESGYQYRREFAELGFKSIVNFTFPKKGNLDSIGAVWQEYADFNKLNSQWDILSFLNNTYFRDADFNNMTNCATTFLLAPGAIQIFYGDEVARQVSLARLNSDPVQSFRSDYTWDKTDTTLLKHYQILGNFRKKHPAVGLGSQTELSKNTFIRVYEDDVVVIKLTNEPKAEIVLGSLFAEGSIVRNGYTSETCRVENNRVTFNSVNNLILVEKAD